MYAVIRTGGKQYKVQAGDLLVVEKIDGETGANVSFGDVLLLGDGADVTLGAVHEQGKAARSQRFFHARHGGSGKIARGQKIVGTKNRRMAGVIPQHG